MASSYQKISKASMLYRWSGWARLLMVCFGTSVRASTIRVCCPCSTGPCQQLCVCVLAVVLVLSPQGSGKGLFGKMASFESIPLLMTPTELGTPEMSVVRCIERKTRRPWRFWSFFRSCGLRVLESLEVLEISVLRHVFLGNAVHLFLSQYST